MGPVTPFLLAKSWNCFLFHSELDLWVKVHHPLGMMVYLRIEIWKDRIRSWRKIFCLILVKILDCGSFLSFTEIWKVLKFGKIQEMYSHTDIYVFIFAYFSYYLNSAKQIYLNFSWILLNLNMNLSVKKWLTYFVVRHYFNSQTLQFIQLIICSSTVFKVRNSICNYHIGKLFFLCSKLASYWGD